MLEIIALILVSILITLLRAWGCALTVVIGLVIVIIAFYVLLLISAWAGMDSSSFFYVIITLIVLCIGAGIAGLVKGWQERKRKNQIEN